MFEKSGTMARKMWRCACAAFIFAAGLPMAVAVWFISEDAVWSDWPEASIPPTIEPDPGPAHEREAGYGEI